MEMARSTHGSGIIISEDGLIITCNHVVPRTNNASERFVSQTSNFMPI